MLVSAISYCTVLTVVCQATFPSTTTDKSVKQYVLTSALSAERLF